MRKDVKAVFKIDQSFNLTIDITVSGHFVDGFPLIGYYFVVDIDGKQANVKITGYKQATPTQRAKFLGDFFHILTIQWSRNFY